MVIDNLVRFPLSFNLIQIDSIRILLILVISSLFNLLFRIRLDPLPVSIDGVITTTNIFFKTIVETSLPNIYDFIGTTRNKVIAVTTKLSTVRMRLESIL